MKETYGVRLTFDQKRMLDHVMRKQNLKNPSDAIRHSIELAYKEEIKKNIPKSSIENDLDIIKKNMQQLFYISLRVMSETDAKVSVMNDVFLTNKDQKFTVQEIKQLIKKYAHDKYEYGYKQMDSIEW